MDAISSLDVQILLLQLALIASTLQAVTIPAWETASVKNWQVSEPLRIINFYGYIINSLEGYTQSGVLIALTVSTLEAKTGLHRTIPQSWQNFEVLKKNQFT